jgi:hypothetical protein
MFTMSIDVSSGFVKFLNVQSGGKIYELSFQRWLIV